MTLTPVDPSNAVAVTSYLESARKWLATAVEQTGPEQIARAKAEIATAAEATKQLGLSKEIRNDAAEMVRRAEYALAKSIRKGQAEGIVRTQGEGSRDNLSDTRTKLPSPYDYASKHELHGAGEKQAGIYALAEHEPEQFDAALSEARAEGNLSRANVARKAREVSRLDTPQRASRRKPITDFSRDAGWELRKAVERLERIAADDRFAANAEQVATHLRSHLTNAVEVCQDLLDRINN